MARLTEAMRTILEYIKDGDAQLYEGYDYSQSKHGRPTGQWFTSNKTRWAAPRYPIRRRRVEVYGVGGAVDPVVARRIVTLGYVDENTGYITEAGRRALEEEG